VHPFNTAAIRMSLEEGAGSRGQSFFSFMGKTMKEKGAMSLYNGLSAGILRQIFYATSRFGLFEVFRDEMAKYRETDIWSRLISGCASGALAAFISCPAEVTLVRLSNDATLPPEKRRNYTGVANAFNRIIKEEGPKAFFSGSAPFVNRAMLVGVVQVGTTKTVVESIPPHIELRFRNI
jgi:solute carrier family 25 (mitochondrial oxoglutarate transporter), member 11